MKERLIEWWAGRDARERTMLAGGLAAVLLIALYVFAWEPIQSSSTRLATDLPRLRAQATQFNRDAADAERLKLAGKNRRGGPGIQTAIDEAAQRANIKGAVKTVQTQGTDRAQVTMAGPVAFDGFARFVADLTISGGVSVESVQIRAADSGRVTIEALVLKAAKGS